MVELAFALLGAGQNAYWSRLITVLVHGDRATPITASVALTNLACSCSFGWNGVQPSGEALTFPHRHGAGLMAQSATIFSPLSGLGWVLSSFSGAMVATR